jgi:hypothetical protein
MSDDRPIAFAIHVKPGEMRTAVDEAEHALLPFAEAFYLYQFKGRVIRFFTVGDKMEYKYVSVTEMREIFERVTTFTDGRRIIDCPTRLAKTYLEQNERALPHAHVVACRWLGGHVIETMPVLP